MGCAADSFECHTQPGCSIVSVPGHKTIRVETRQGSALPAKLQELGYAPRLVANEMREGPVTEVITAHSTTGKPIHRSMSGSCKWTFWNSGLLSSWSMSALPPKADIDVN
jgi:hypothetical protein